MLQRFSQRVTFVWNTGHRAGANHKPSLCVVVTDTSTPNSRDVRSLRSPDFNVLPVVSASCRLQLPILLTRVHSRSGCQSDVRSRATSRYGPADGRRHAQGNPRAGEPARYRQCPCARSDAHSRLKTAPWGRRASQTTVLQLRATRYARSWCERLTP